MDLNLLEKFREKADVFSVVSTAAFQQDLGLKRCYPNRFINPKLRQLLQILRDNGILEFGG